MPDPGNAWHPSTGRDHEAFKARIALARRKHGPDLRQALVSCPPSHIAALQEKVHESSSFLQDGRAILTESRTMVATSGGEHSANVHAVELIFASLLTATRHARASGQRWQVSLKAHTAAHSCYAAFLEDHHKTSAELSSAWV